MANTVPIRIWNRAQGREEIEEVYGGALVHWLYETPAGQSLADKIFSRHWFSRLYGAYQGSSLSQHKTARFIRDFKIRMEEFEPGPFPTFNDFFIRRFKKGARTFATEPRVMPAFCEARYLAFESVAAELEFPVKGSLLTAERLLGSAERANPFIGGPLLIARLAPTDYHRFHYPVQGKTLTHYRIPGPLHSVNPAALRFNGAILTTNERHVSILDGGDFGRLAYVEVGALCVGRIVQTRDPAQAFARGDEKGYFLFGASTVIVMGEPGRWKPDSDLLIQTREGREAFVPLGEGIATLA